MSIFTKNKVLLELINKLNHMENKIDILDNKFESTTFLNGCCDCKTREPKLFNDLQEFLETKLINLKDSLIESILNQQQIKENDNSILKNIIEETCNKHTSDLNSILQKCNTHDTSIKNDLLNQFKYFENYLVNLSNFLENSKTELLQQQNLKNTSDKEQDLSLRTDLQTFLVGLQTNILNSNIKSNDIFNELLNNQYNNFVKDDKITEILETINKNVNSFYYDNEIIKHQIMLEEDIQKYNDEIDNIRTLALNAKNSIEKTLSSFNLNNELDC